MSNINNSKSKVGRNMKVLGQVKRDRMWSGARTKKASNGANAESFLGSHFFYDTTRQEMHGLDGTNNLGSGYYQRMPTKRMNEIERTIQQ